MPNIDFDDSKTDENWWNALDKDFSDAPNIDESLEDESFWNDLDDYIAETSSELDDTPSCEHGPCGTNKPECLLCYAEISRHDKDLEELHQAILKEEQ